MSYTLSAIASKANIAGLTASVADHKELEGPAVDEASTHLDAAAAAAAILAEAIGVDADQLAVSITGHANPDHGKVEGWSDEYITVTVAVSR